MNNLKIVVRERRGYVREACGHTTWTEYQVWQGRKILERFVIRRHAEEFIARHEAKAEEPTP